MHDVHASRDFSCALTEGGSAVCWGHNDRGQLGTRGGISSSSPVHISDEPTFLDISTKPAGRHVCGIATDGIAYCWGANGSGQIGQPPTDSVSVPQRVTSSIRFASISAGWNATCAVTLEGDAYCWGRGGWGSLGDGEAADSSEPVRVAGGHVFEKVEVGTNHLACGLTIGGTIMCWGLDFGGGLGSPGVDSCSNNDGLTLPCSKTPQPIDDPDSFVDVSTGQSYACGLTTSGQVKCWGRNGSGQLGRVTDETCEEGEIWESQCGRTPSLVSGSESFVSVAAGTFHTCAVSDSGVAYCWGSNSLGQQGNGTLGTDLFAPSPVIGGISFTSVSPGSEHTCGEGTDGELYCWGANQWGQLGTGDLRGWYEPARVVDPL